MRLTHFDTQSSGDSHRAKVTVHNIFLELSDDENNVEFVKELIPEFIEPLKLKIIGSEMNWLRHEGKNLVTLFVEAENKHMPFDREVVEGFLELLS